ncbi:hypothetical protein [Flavisolibacter ginsenosidimutans]|uniref:Uncharacterized protein n=1 Tax=Flavisolibacter ginsenosidimutans TaxID=661481 RepID=A0A5B8ULF0_9BACT|nr:hypothetical protein [Flavisolibacter ginsenosidimutans]QEC56835.1 hypothetical protein FSB75_13315 [Flavisolibacter ginsenosidimutans]
MKKQPKSAVQKECSLSVTPKTRPSYEDVELINPKKVPLTPEVLRTFEGFEHTSEEEAENICHTSFEFVYILLDLLARKNNSFIDNQHVVSLNENESLVVSINKNQSNPNKNKAA